MDVDDIAGSLRTLHERFYDGYPRNYFHDALHLAIAALQSPAQALAPLQEDQYLPTESGKSLHLRLDQEDIHEENIRKTAKLQLANLYYHCLETVVRLFLAHHPQVDVPWLEMVREYDFREFKRKTAEVARFASDWTGSHPEDEWFRLAFWPVATPDEDGIRRLSAAKQWMGLAALETLDGPAYNAFKHGLAMQAGEETVGFYPRTLDSEEDEEPIFEAKGDALIILRQDRQAGGGREWIRETRWLKLPEKIAVIYVIQKYYIGTLLTVGARRFLGRSLTNLSIPDWPPAEALQHARKEGLSMDRFTVSLGLEDRPP